MYGYVLWMMINMMIFIHRPNSCGTYLVFSMISTHYGMGKTFPQKQDPLVSVQCISLANCISIVRMKTLILTALNLIAFEKLWNILKYEEVSTKKRGFLFLRSRIKHSNSWSNSNFKPLLYIQHINYRTNIVYSSTTVHAIYGSMVYVVYVKLQPKALPSESSLPLTLPLSLL